MTGCGGSNDNNNDDPDNSAFPIIEKLELDFTLSLSDLGVTPQTLSGVTFNTERGVFTILDNEATIFYLQPDGSLDSSTKIQGLEGSTLTGIEHIENDVYLLSDLAGVVYRYDASDSSLKIEADLSGDISSLKAVAYDSQNLEVVLTSDAPTKKLFRVSQNQTVTQIPLESRFENYSIDGLQVGENGIYIASKGFSGPSAEEENAVIILTDESGRFESALSLDNSDISGLAILDEEGHGFISVNGDTQASITLYEPTPEASTPEFTPLSGVDSLELDFDQPSGIDFNLDNQAFYYITDFGEVRTGDELGNNELLFELENQQGSYESIKAHVENQELTIFLLNSDESDDNSRILTFNSTGELQNTQLIDKVDESHVFESLEYNAGTQTLYSLNFNEDSPKFLYEFTETGITTNPLGEMYDDYAITGMAMSEDANTLYFVTKEYVEGDTMFAGVLVVFDLTQSLEIARFSITDPSDPTVGLTAPSGIALDQNNNLIFITTDMDDATLNIYQTP